jgi:RNA polymerase sigma factor (sigma-70 family)
MTSLPPPDDERVPSAVPASTTPGAPEGTEVLGDLTHSMLLMHRYQGGDDDALNELFDRYYDRVQRIARIRMGPWLRNLTESDDIVQNTFTVAFNKIGGIEIRDHASIIQYLSKVLENQIRGAVRYFGAQKRDPGRVVALEQTQSNTQSEIMPVDEQLIPIDQLLSQELKDTYDACVHSLAHDQREVVLLKEYAGASWAEIQRALERPTVHAAQELYCRAQIRLAECLRRKIT